MMIWDSRKLHLFKKTPIIIDLRLSGAEKLGAFGILLSSLIAARKHDQFIALFYAIIEFVLAHMFYLLEQC
jgi:hypothetical protein